MPKLKLTKTALKSQRDALKQFTRFLPTLQLKKQQLQMEMRRCQERLRENEEKENTLRRGILAWLPLFGTEFDVKELRSFIRLEKVNTKLNNIAGVDVPVFESAVFKVAEYNLFIVEPWFDDALEVIKELVELRAEHDIIQEQYNLIGNELRVTTQRVNLFEKVKIPECRENIRKIRIYLGDMDTSAVGRSKIAKRKVQEVTL
ncbi:MAG: V-type ATP synthase subunit D [Lentisphaerae bacterium GWF2_45_14]|nr:MAG: V-type ATP synthase subunit D [Lentisphaerae bacterium GWF2_45_14]